MLARLNSLMQGYSGIHPETVHLIKELINNDVTPHFRAWRRGRQRRPGVQLAHLGLVLIGEGEVLYKKEIDRQLEVFKQLNIKPLSIHIREGLAILNGTSAMTGIGMANIISAETARMVGALLSAMINKWWRPTTTTTPTN